MPSYNNYYRRNNKKNSSDNNKRMNQSNNPQRQTPGYDVGNFSNGKPIPHRGQFDEGSSGGSTSSGAGNQSGSRSHHYQGNYDRDSSYGSFHPSGAGNQSGSRNVYGGKYYKDSSRGRQNVELFITVNDVPIQPQKPVQKQDPEFVITVDEEPELEITIEDEKPVQKQEPEFVITIEDSKPENTDDEESEVENAVNKPVQPKQQPKQQILHVVVNPSDKTKLEVVGDASQINSIKKTPQLMQLQQPVVQFVAPPINPQPKFQVVVTPQKKIEHNDNQIMFWVKKGVENTVRYFGLKRNQCENINRKLEPYKKEIIEVMKHFSKQVENKEGIMTTVYPRFQIKANSYENCSVIPKNNIQFTLLTKGDINQHKILLPKPGAKPLLIVIAHEKATIKSITADLKKATNNAYDQTSDTDKFIHCIPFDANEDDYTEFYQPYRQGESGVQPWRVLDVLGDKCSLKKCSYNEASQEQEMIDVKEAHKMKYEAKLKQDKLVQKKEEDKKPTQEQLKINGYEYIVGMYLRVYLYIRHNVVWEFYKDKDYTNLSSTTLLKGLETVKQIFDTKNGNKTIRTIICDDIRSCWQGDRFDMNFFQNSIVNVLAKHIFTSIHTQDQASECLEVISKEYIEPDLLEKKAIRRSKKRNGVFKEGVDIMKEKSTIREIRHPYHPDVVFKVGIRTVLSECDLKEAIENYYRLIQSQGHQIRFAAKFIHEDDMIKVYDTRLKPLRERYSDVIDEIIERGQYCEIEDWTEIDGELEMLEEYIPIVRFAEQLSLREYINAWKPNPTLEEGRKITERLKIFTTLSAQLYAIEVRKRYIQANYEQLKVNISTIDYSTSINDRSETGYAEGNTFQHNHLIRDFETIFTDIAFVYMRTDELFSQIFPMLDQSEREQIELFVNQFQYRRPDQNDNKSDGDSHSEDK